jgi:argininosuccinate lyase
MESAGRLHTGRSRNDQIVLDLRLYMRAEVLDFVMLLISLIETLTFVTKDHRDAIMPGYTHLQQAQPILLAHHVLAYFEIFQRDKERFQDCLGRADFMPLGSGALAGVPYPIDREFVARQLASAR